MKSVEKNSKLRDRDELLIAFNDSSVSDMARGVVSNHLGKKTRIVPRKYWGPKAELKSHAEPRAAAMDASSSHSSFQPSYHRAQP